jgi:hypothetical protein
VSSIKGEGNRHFDKLDLGASNDVRKCASLLSFKLKVRCYPFLGDSSGLFFNGAWGSSMRRANGNPRNSKTRSAQRGETPQPFYKKDARLEATNPANKCARSRAPRTLVMMSRRYSHDLPLQWNFI